MKQEPSKEHIAFVTAMTILIACALIWGSVTETHASYLPTPSTYTIYGSISLNPGTSLTDTWIALEFPAVTPTGQQFTGFDAESIGSFPAGQTTSFSVTAKWPGDSPVAYTIVGVYDVANSGVTVGSNSITTGMAWPFTGNVPGHWDFTKEGDVASLLENPLGNIDVARFYMSNTSLLGTDAMGATLDLWSFSDRLSLALHRHRFRCLVRFCFSPPVLADSG